ncbi:MAG TPA: PQQ-dependent sugar dehydrogenase [Pirellulaceae bacterium]|nr:PQQ-dependent sugar dehydrogenase [Pirellulaceae bacterium]HMO93968.1 PQQ-dependent sugar dehydrogenase [Pirellulaceae bacterium]HMP70826.1 PQQ-dependent sugar dehydrogenase [Pirellulaceae bacterium]
MDKNLHRKHRLPYFGMRLALSLGVVFIGVVTGHSQDRPADNSDAIAVTKSRAGATQDDPPRPLPPKIADASDEGRLAIAAIKLPTGVTATLFAAEPDVVNPVAIDVDHLGNVFVCESFRQARGIEDNRDHPEWLIDDLSATTVADRLAYMHQHLGERIATYSEHDDRIRILTDTNGDGTADVSQIFVDGFNRPEEGTGAGVLRIGNQVWFTCIPNLWRFDLHDDGSMHRTKVHSGFGVRFAFRGHDLHGLTLGPDGRLYFSIGDRGYNVNESIADPESGAVFRCELDGSGLEVVATGLRNPQELTFDDFGNLFTCDNNSDSGIDQARLIHVVEGADYGWRMQYQYMPDRGPYIREGIWDPETTNRPAYTVPAIAALGDGPSGLTYYPGTGWSDDYLHHFFVCDFRGQANNSGIRTFTLEPAGASFKLNENQKAIWGVLATDVDFGPDGRLYIADWVEGWTGPGKGRIYALQHERAAHDPVVAEVASMLREGMGNRTDNELASLLGHRDRRIRMGAQFELAKREKFDVFLDELERASNIFSQLHALWGMGQLLRTEFQLAQEQRERMIQTLDSLFKTNQADLIGQVCRFVGENGIAELEERLLSALRDENDQVKFHAVIASSKLASPQQLVRVARFITENSHRDAMLAHAGVMAMYHLGRQFEKTLPAGQRRSSFVSSHPYNQAIRMRSSSVRRACIVALRKQRSALCAAGIGDPDEGVAMEAVCAVYDLQVKDAWAKAFGALNSTPHRSAALLRRLMHINYRLGETQNALVLSQFATNPKNELALRIEAVKLLGEWETTNPIDAVDGRVHPIQQRSVMPIKMLMGNMWPKIHALEEDLQLEFIHAATKIRVPTLTTAFTEIAADAAKDSAIRTAALSAVVANEPTSPGPLLESLLDAEVPELRRLAVSLVSKSSPQQVMPAIKAMVESDSTSDRQHAFHLLSTMSDEESLSLLSSAMENYSSIPADTQLDVYQALLSRREELGDERVERFSTILAEPPFGLYRLTLVGGDRASGKIVYEKTELSCVRCHKIGSIGGDVGPDLTRIGADKDRTYLLRALLDPNAEIAENFSTVLILDLDGRSHVGIVRHQDEVNLHLIDDQGRTSIIPKNEIDVMKETKSAMPADLVDKMSLLEVRDLIEYLANLR